MLGEMLQHCKAAMSHGEKLQQEILHHCKMVMLLGEMSEADVAGGGHCSVTR